MVEAIFDRPQERLGAEPGNAQFGIILDLVLALFTQPFERFAFGRIDDRISHRPRRQCKHAQDQIAGRVTDEAARRRAALMQRIEADRPIGLNGIGLNPPQRLRSLTALVMTVTPSAISSTTISSSAA